MQDVASQLSPSQRINLATQRISQNAQEGLVVGADYLTKIAGIPLSPPAVVAMERLATNTMRVVDLAKLVGVTHGVMSRQLQDLEAKGLVERVEDERDRRAAPARLTGKGLEVVRLAAVLRDRFVRQILREWPEEDPEHIAGIFERFAGGISLKSPIDLQAAFDPSLSIEERTRLIEES